MSLILAQKNIDLVFQNVKKVIVGKDKQILQAMACWLAGGHLFAEAAGYLDFKMIENLVHQLELIFKS